MTGYRAIVLVASTRAAAYVHHNPDTSTTVEPYPDRSGPILHAWLTQSGYHVDPVRVVADKDIRPALETALAEAPDLILTSGGTGMMPTDRTADHTAELVDYQVPGIAERLRSYAADKIPCTVLSRGIAGVKGTTLIINIPGSVGAANDATVVLAGFLKEAIDSVHGVHEH